MISTSAFRCRGDVTKLLMYGDLRVTVVVNSGSVTNMFISNLRSSKTKNSTPHFVVRDWQCWCTVAERDRRQGMRKKNCWFSSVSCRLLTLPLALFHTIWWDLKITQLNAHWTEQFDPRVWNCAVIGDHGKPPDHLLKPRILWLHGLVFLSS